jgi:hypothetical protein
MGKGGAERRTREAEVASAIAHRLGRDPRAITRIPRPLTLLAFLIQKFPQTTRYGALIDM